MKLFSTIAGAVAALIILNSCISFEPDKLTISIAGNSVEADGNYTVHIEYPVFHGYPELSDAIAETVSRWEQQFLESFQALRDAGSDAPATLTITWSPAQMNLSYISLILECYSYTGGANGLQFMETFTWDAKNNQQLTLESVLQMNAADLFPYLADMSREQLKQVLIHSASDKSMESMIHEGTEPVPENFQLFTVSPRYITLYFNKYQVAAGYYGMQTVQIPLPEPSRIQ